MQQDYEKLGVFYLGRERDLASTQPKDGLVLYDSRDLVTHAMVIGMTGSGKTGLGIGLLEEAAIDGVPAIAIDPKGDLANLMLTFPSLSPAEFRPWINEDEAVRKGVTPDQFAAEQAEFWQKGLASWNQDASRVARLREAVEVSIYTPGSTAGLPLSVLRSFAAPPPELAADRELLAERVGTSVTSLLTLLGIEADPVRSREHILLSTIVGAAWEAREDLDLAALIGRIQKPPMARVGVMDLDSFFPASDRFALAMRLNALLAAPGFSAWMEGEPLDVGRLLFTASGRPRLSIISIAHLSDAERMFIVSMVFNETVGWMRRQQGTTSLRAIVYMDEVSGYLPPVANPPSKLAMMTLLKQARAFGLGIVLATQNPGDLDYKALSNLGTWMIGRLQTDRDKDKVLQGLEGALAGSGRFDRATLDKALAGLAKRVFLMNNVHDESPVLFETRWTLSYLRGPLTRDQIKTLMAPQLAASARAGAEGGARGAATGASAPASGTPAGQAKASDGGAAQPVLPPDVPQFFLPWRGTTPPAYEPRLFAAATVDFSDTKLRVSDSREVAVLVPVQDGAVEVDWSKAAESEVALNELESAPEAGAAFAALPAAASRPKNYPAWQKAFARWLFQSQQLDLLRDDETTLTSTPGESERDFRIRLQLALRERRDATKEKLQQKYGPRRASLEEKLRRADAAKAREEAQASERKLDTALSVGASLVGALFGRKTFSATNVNRAASAARGVSRIGKENQDVARAAQNREEVLAEMSALDAELEGELAKIDAQPDALTVPLTTLSVKAKKTGIAVKQVALAWVGGEEV